jgi:hypothetical protein
MGDGGVGGLLTIADLNKHPFQSSVYPLFAAPPAVPVFVKARRYVHCEQIIAAIPNVLQEGDFT